MAAGQPESGARTGAAGQATVVGFSLTVPFVASGTYAGTLTWTASAR